MIITYHLNTSDLFDSIIDNAYLSSALPKTSAEVDIFLLVYILLLIWINLVSFYVQLLHY